MRSAVHTAHRVQRPAQHRDGRSRCVSQSATLRSSGLYPSPRCSCGAVFPGERSGALRLALIAWPHAVLTLSVTDLLIFDLHRHSCCRRVLHAMFCADSATEMQLSCSLHAARTALPMAIAGADMSFLGISATSTARRGTLVQLCRWSDARVLVSRDGLCVAPVAHACADPPTDCRHQLLTVGIWGLGRAQLPAVCRLPGPQLVPTSCVSPSSGASVSRCVPSMHMAPLPVYRAAPTSSLGLREVPYWYTAV